jgi:sialic acid synthase SpsE
VKFQTFRAIDHYSKRSPSFNYLGNVNTHDLIKSLELNRSWQKKLKLHAEAQGLIFFSSPCDLDAIKSLEDINVELYKVASFDLTDESLISEIAKTKKPIILSTGMATLYEIQNAVDASLSMNNNNIILLQCTSLYPALPKLSNLHAMQTLRGSFNTLVGYSDHTIGDHICIAAVTLGACLIEKHFTIDRNLPGPDHSFAMETYELKEMIKKIRDVESAFGDGIKNGPRVEEREMAEKGKRSLHAKIDISKGEVIQTEMLSVKRPGLGIHPSMKKYVIGKYAKQDISADEWISWQMI